MLFPVVLFGEPLFSHIFLPPSFQRRIEQSQFLPLKVKGFDVPIDSRIETIYKTNHPQLGWDYLVLDNDWNWCFRGQYDLSLVEPYTLVSIINYGQAWKTHLTAWPIFNQYDIELLKTILNGSKSGRIVENGDPIYYEIKQEKWNNDFVKQLKMELIINYCAQKQWF